MNWESGILGLLSASLVRPFVLVAAALLVLRVFRVGHPASKHAVWTFVLGGMVLLPFASLIAPHMDVPALPQGALRHVSFSTETSPTIVIDRQPAESEPVTRLSQADQAVSVSETVSLPALPTVSPSVAAVSSSLSVRTVLLWCYLAGVAAFALYRIAGWILFRRLLSRSRPLKLKPLRECDDVTIPVAVGIWRPAVVLPSNWRQWDAATRRAILSHELAHIRRRDAWVLMLSRWAKCLFWFHPLVWWVSRKTTELAEMACDAVAVRAAGDPTGYAKILLDFSNVVNHRGYRATLPGLAMVGQSPLSRRIDQLFAESAGRLRRPGIVLALVGIPTLCAAATLGLTESLSRPLVQAKQIVAGKLESGLPVGFAQQPLPALALSFLGLEPLPSASQQPAMTPREFLDRHCVQCHNASYIAGIRLDQLDLTHVQENADIWEKVIRKLRGGVQIMNSPKPDPSAVRNFVEWLEGELDRGNPVAVRPPLPHPLNRTEYRNAIRDLFGLDVDTALLFPADDMTQGLDNIAEALQDSSARPALYKVAADRISDLVMASPSRSKVYVCRPAVPSEDAACYRRIVENLATRAFRRPATPEEMNALMQVFESKYAAGPGRPWIYFDAGVDAVLRNVLTNRSFLYRTDVEPSNIATGQTYRVNDFDLASRLSFFLWSTGPDDQLLDLARRGQLQNPAIMERETRRMLKDPRAEALTLNFASEWLWLRNLQRFQPLPAYADFDEPLRQAMRRETELFFSSIVQEDRNVLDLMTANYTFLNERLARHYGIQGITGPEFRRVTLTPAFDVRRGLVGKAAILTVTSHPDRTSLTQRGKVVLSSLLGLHVPDPPPNVLPLPEKLDLPMRRVMDQANAVRPTCVTCHKIFDPIGIALDNFDLAGKWRTQENGQTIDPVTELNDGTRLSGPADVRNAIGARSELFTRILTQKLLTYALGRGTGAQDMPLVRSIVRDAARDNNRFSAIVMGIVKSAPFQMNLKS